MKIQKYVNTESLSACRGSSVRQDAVHLFRANDACTHLARKEEWGSAV